MTAGAQCDNCRTFAPMPMENWIVLTVQEPQQGGVLAMFYGQSSPSLLFCTMRCVAEYAIAHTLISGPATGEEPNP